MKSLQDLENEVKRLRMAVEELSILNEIATAIGSTLSLDRIIDLIIQKCVRHMNVEQAAVMILDEKESGKPFKTMVRMADKTNHMMPYRLDEQLTGWMLKNQKPLRINDFLKDDRFRSFADKDLPIRSMLSVPLMLKGRMTGLVTLFNKKSPEGFPEEDQRLMSIIAAQSAQVIENARLYEEEQALLRMQEEYRLASEIQNKLLPMTSPDIEGYDILGVAHPAQIVGGDYFDLITIDDHRLVVCLGDISGKGLPAAMLMANLQATIRAQVLLNPLPTDCLESSNRLLYQNTDSFKFATLFYGILDTKKNELCYSNAGHNLPILFSPDKEPVTLATSGLALSFVEKTEYEEGRIIFNPGDLLLIYSDGITESMNAHSEEFGEDQLIRIVQSSASNSSGELSKEIVSAVLKHAGEQPQSDDMTMIIIRRESEPASS